MIGRRLENVSEARAFQAFQVMRQSAVILTSIVLAKSGLPLETIGAWELLLFIGNAGSFFWVNGLLAGIAPGFAGKTEDERKTFIFNIFLLFSALSIVFFLALNLGKPTVVRFFSGKEDLPGYALFSVYLLFNLPAHIVEYYYLMHQKSKQILGWGLLSLIGHLAAVFLPLAAGGGLVGSIGALTALAAFKWLWAAKLAADYGRLQPNAKVIWAYFLFCVPLIANTLVGNLITLFDNWLVGWYYQDEAMFALYRYGSREFPLAVALTSGLSAAMVLPIAQSLHRGAQELKTRTTRLMHLLFPMTIVLMFLSKPLFPIVFNKDLSRGAELFNIYMLTLGGRILIPSAVLTALKDTRTIFWTSLLELAVKIILGAAGIYLAGLEGLAWSVVVAFALEKAVHTLVLYFKHGISPRSWLNVNVYMIYVILLWTAYGVTCLL